MVPSVQCEDSVGSVSWAQSDGAESYVAVAVGLDSHTHTCASHNPNCTWDGLHCGNLYGITVIAEDALCSSLPSSSTLIHTGTCPRHSSYPGIHVIYVLLCNKFTKALDRSSANSCTVTV